ncbi:MAG: hypothetical protein ABIQ18_18280 [Umezawaea sp.]
MTTLLNALLVVLGLLTVFAGFVMYRLWDWARRGCQTCERRLTAQLPCELARRAFGWCRYGVRLVVWRVTGECGS